MRANDDLLSVQNSIYTLVDSEGYLVREDTLGERKRYPLNAGGSYEAGEGLILSGTTFSVGSDPNVNITSVWTDYNWHLITFTYDHDTHTWCPYLDGNLLAQGVFSQNLLTASTRQGPLVIGLGSPSLCGHSTQAGSHSFRISDFRLWKRALTAAEVQKLVNA